MTKWWAKLQGTEQELELLREHLAESNHRIIRDGSFFYLKLADLPDDIEPAILKDQLSRFMAILNGAAKLRFGKFTGVNSYGVVRFNKDGTKTGLGFLTLSESSGVLTLAPLPDGILDNWVLAGSNDDLVERALALYGTLDHNWRSLYMVLEVIEDDLGGETAVMRTKWVSSAKVKQFKRTANSFRALGQDARHATIKNQPPSSPMPLSDAQELIEDILRKWLESKSQVLNAG